MPATTLFSKHLEEAHPCPWQLESTELFLKLFPGDKNMNDGGTGSRSAKGNCSFGASRSREPRRGYLRGKAPLCGAGVAH